MLKVIIDLTSDPAAAKDLIPLTISSFTDIELSDKQVDVIIDSMQTSSFDVCMAATQESFCNALIPQCIFDHKGSYLYHKRPCYESCLYIQNEVCTDQKPFFQMIKAIMKNGDRFDCDRFGKYNASNIKCHLTDSAKANTMGNQQKRNDETNQLRTSEIFLITSLCISGTILLIAIIAFNNSVILIRFKHWHQQNVESGETVAPYCAIHVANIKLIEPTEIDCKLNIKEEDAK